MHMQLGKEWKQDGMRTEKGEEEEEELIERYVLACIFCIIQT
jgi:hypothetical protein